MVRAIPSHLVVGFLLGVAAALGGTGFVVWLAGGRDRLRLRTYAVHAAVFFVTLAVYVGNGTRHLQVDPQPAAFTALSLVRSGWFDLTEYEWNVEPMRKMVLIRGADGLTYSQYPPGSALACVPFVASFAWSGPPTSVNLDWASKRAGAVTSALSVALVLAALRRLVPGPPAWIATVAYAFGTTVFSTASQDSWTHGPAMAGLALALYGLVLSHPAAPRAAALVGLGLGWAVVSRVTLLPSAFLVALYFLFRDRGRFWFLSLGALPLAAFWTAYATRVYGSPFRTGYGVRDPDIELLVPGFAANLWATLFDGSRGIFVYSPFLLVGLIGFPALLRALRRRHEPLAAICVLALGAVPIVVMVARMNLWSGGWSYGNRTTSECAVLLLPAFALAVAALWPSRPGRVLVAASVAASVGIHTLEYAFPNDLWNAMPGLQKGPQATPQIVVHLKHARYRLGLTGERHH